MSAQKKATPSCSAPKRVFTIHVQKGRVPTKTSVTRKTKTNNRFHGRSLSRKTQDAMMSSAVHEAMRTQRAKTTQAKKVLEAKD